MTEEIESRKEFERSTYIGRLLEGKKLTHHFTRIDPNTGEERGFHFPKAKASAFWGAKIGRIYNMVDGIPDVWSEAEVGVIDDPERLQAQDRIEALKKEETNVSASPELDEALRVIREARQAASPFKRTPFDIWVLSQIQKKG